MNFQPLAQAGPAIQIHVAAAVVAFGLGAVILFREKGGRLHRTMGRVWVVTMLVVTLSSFFIHTIRLWGLWSPIHILSVGTTFSLAYGVWLARRHDIVSHRRTMQGTYCGALIIAGFFTFMPGRIMHEVFLSGSGVGGPLLLLVPASIIVVLAARMMLPARRETRA